MDQATSRVQCILPYLISGTIGACIGSFLFFEMYGFAVVNIFALAMFIKGVIN